MQQRVDSISGHIGILPDVFAGIEIGRGITLFLRAEQQKMPEGVQTGLGHIRMQPAVFPFVEVALPRCPSVRVVPETRPESDVPDCRGRSMGRQQRAGETYVAEQQQLL